MYLKMDSLPLPLQPAVVKVGKYLAFACQVNDLKRLIQRMEIPDASSILENKTFTAAREALPVLREQLKTADGRAREFIQSTIKEIATFPEQ